MMPYIDKERWYYLSFVASACVLCKFASSEVLFAVSCAILASSSFLVAWNSSSSYSDAAFEVSDLTFESCALITNCFAWTNELFANGKINPKLFSTFSNSFNSKLYNEMIYDFEMLIPDNGKEKNNIILSQKI